MDKKAKKIISFLTLLSCLTIVFTSCEKHNPNSPGVEFMPDMYRSPSLEGNMGYTSISNGNLMQGNKSPVVL